MHKTLSLDRSIMMRTVAAAAMVLLVGAGIQASAWGAESGSGSEIPVQYTAPSFVGHSIDTARGPAFVTGHVGSMDTLMMPGSGAQSFLMNNGNGSATLLTPGSAPQTVFTPR
jgi:hypothetical protein